jgi:hypothetical protein
MEAAVMQEVRKSLMGHSSGEDVNSIYTHVELPAKRQAIRKLEAWLSTQSRDESSSKEVLEIPQRKETNVIEIHRERSRKPNA